MQPSAWTPASSNASTGLNNWLSRSKPATQHGNTRLWSLKAQMTWSSKEFGLGVRFATTIYSRGSSNLQPARCYCPGWTGGVCEHLMRPGWRWLVLTWRTPRLRCGTRVRAPRWISTSSSCPKASSGQSTDWAVWWIELWPSVTKWPAARLLSDWKYGGQGRSWTADASLFRVKINSDCMYLEVPPGAVSYWKSLQESPTAGKTAGKFCSPCVLVGKQSAPDCISGVRMSTSRDPRSRVLRAEGSAVHTPASIAIRPMATAVKEQPR